MAFERTHQANNRAVVTVEGIREKLRVLLVSGEPHAGERTWRNLLKSDANVDLVHFTILRPGKAGRHADQRAVADRLPDAELFQQKIKEFDLIIFDRYANQSVLPSTYFENIVRYVREGGAVMVAAGPEFAGRPASPARGSRPSYRAIRTDASSSSPTRHASPAAASGTRSLANSRAPSRIRRPGASGCASSERS